MTMSENSVSTGSPKIGSWSREEFVRSQVGFLVFTRQAAGAPLAPAASIFAPRKLAVEHSRHRNLSVRTSWVFARIRPLHCPWPAPSESSLRRRKGNAYAQKKFGPEEGPRPRRTGGRQAPSRVAWRPALPRAAGLPEDQLGLAVP